MQLAEDTDEKNSVYDVSYNVYPSTILKVRWNKRCLAPWLHLVPPVN